MRIAFFGESFVNGIGDPECLGWPGRLCAEATKAGHDVTYYNLGIRGETTERLRARWRREADLRLSPEQDPRLVFCFGVNDCSLEGDFEREIVPLSVANARAILTEAQDVAPVLMVGPLPTTYDEENAMIGTLSTAYAALCAEIGVPYLDAFRTMVHSTVWREEALAGDDTHPGAGGYGELAALVSAWDAWRDWFTSRG